MKYSHFVAVIFMPIRELYVTSWHNMASGMNSGLTNDYNHGILKAGSCANIPSKIRYEQCSIFAFSEVDDMNSKNKIGGSLSAFFLGGVSVVRSFDLCSMKGTTCEMNNVLNITALTK